MVKNNSTDQKVAMDLHKFQKLLHPIAAFLRAGGLTERDADRLFASAYRRCARSHPIRKVRHIKYANHFGEIISRWQRHPHFLDMQGRPKALPLHGTRSLRSLIAGVNPKLHVNSILSVLQRYGTVRRKRGGLYELVVPYFSTSTPEELAFEPLSSFLFDASSTLARLLTPAKARKVESFWRSVDSTALSEGDARKFTLFIKERSQIFLEEIDEWLNAHARKNVGIRKRGLRRVGLGLFSIYSKL